MNKTKTLDRQVTRTPEIRYRRKAVERMGAQVGLESDLGKGSQFWIQLKKG